MKRFLLSSLACALLLMMASVAFGQEGACAPDIEKFCKGIPPGEGKIAMCLKQNQTGLSPACKIHIAKTEEALKEVDKACEDDIHQHCAGVQPGGGRIKECLKAHKHQLSLKCKLTIAEEKREMK